MNVDETVESNQNYKVVLVGDGGTGKSSFVDRLSDGEFRKDYIATIGMEKHEIIVETSLGSVTLLLCDTSGQEKVGPLRDEYYEGVSGAVLFFDVTSRITYKNIPQWQKDINRVSPDIPIALCANKVDVKPCLRKVKEKNITCHKNWPDVKYFEMSVKESRGLKEPIEYILQIVKKAPSLKVTGSIGSYFCDDFQGLNV